MEDYWIIDSGTSDHITNRREWFFEYQQFVHPLKIYIGNGEKVSALEQGNIRIETRVNGEMVTRDHV